MANAARSSLAILLCGVVASTLLLSCGASLKATRGSNIIGKASWYGGRFHGRKTASGERFDKHALTAAHRELPFGTRVRVTSVNTGRSVEVRINDRGPFGRRERIIDLSEGAAEVLGMKRSGVVRVKLEVLSVPEPKR